MKTESVVTKKRRFRWITAVGLAGLFGLLVFGMNGTLSARVPAMGAPSAAQEAVIPAVSWKPPDPATIPNDKLGESIRMGRNIIINTPSYAAHYVGNKMTCADCHLGEGTRAYSSPLAGITTVFPAFTKRDRRVITIEHRIQECFERSENGMPPPPNSRVMVAIVAYMNWLSKGIPMGSTVKGRGLKMLTQPAHISAAEGATIYAHQCEVCHGADGQGIAGSFPPVWGPGSFNDAAGLSKVPKMAAFVKANMPKTRPGSLSVQEAYDVAAFVTAKPHPHFKGAK